ncbi:MAG: hypothetical protein RJA36_2142 [Pseudomonadota bacterium]|jgi:methyl-accepting chemotaxis protein
MKNLTVRGKLTLAFGTLVLIVLLIASAGIFLLSAANIRFDNFVNGINARLHMVERMRAAVDQRAIAARNLVLVTRPQDLAQEKEAVEKAHAEVSDALNQLNRLAESSDVLPEGRRMIAAIGDVEKRYAPVALGIVDLVLKGEHEKAIQRMNDDCRPLLAQLSKAANDYVEFTARRSETLVKAAHAAYAFQRNALIFGIVAAVALSVAAGVLIARSLATDLGAEPGELRDIFTAVAAGDLTRRIVLRAGDTSSVLAAVQRMQAGLIRIVSEVRLEAEAVSSASRQISAGNQELASRTTSQASSLEETAASMEQFGTTVSQNADNARQASQLFRDASEVAAHGGEVVGQVVQTMQGINDSSRKISEIIGVIDGIAFQTNILALNAAVEAARAGEQGRGFAVVASEVRSLAGRSSEAAREIKSLITDSVERVERGAAQVEGAGQTMSDIVTGIQRVTGVVSEIAVASQEQAQGVRQVGAAVAHMDQAIQQNASMVEDMAGAASSLDAKARNLVKTMAAFKLPA